MPARPHDSDPGQPGIRVPGAGRPHRSRGKRTRQWAARITAGAAAAALVAGGGWWIDYRIVHHTFAFWAPPLNLTYCGRDFVFMDTLPSLPHLDNGGTLIPIYRQQPGNWQVYKQAYEPSDKHPDCPTDGPAGTLELVRNSHEVDEYSLSGGP